MKKKRTKIQKAMIFVVIATVVALLLSIPAIGTSVANIFKIPGDMFVSTARKIAIIGISITLILVGAGSVIPILAIGLVAIGLTVLVATVWPWFKSSPKMATAK